MSEQDLELWLESNKLSKIAHILNENDIETLDDIKETLETVEDINSLAAEMELKTVLKKKFIKAVKKLNNITEVTEENGTSHKKSSQQIPQNNTPEPGANTEEKEEKETLEGIAHVKRKRKRYNLRGVHKVDQLKKLTVGKRHRTIMVIGATGTGKSTLLNSMMNYLWDVKHSDPYRFKLIYETLKAHGDAESVTDNVTAYHLSPPTLDYELTVIDTPGFGDTRGLAQDQKITKQIKKFFETKIQEIDAICFVIRAPQSRLTATQKYIFAQPPALAALKAGHVPFKAHFKLNNSAFNLPEDDEEEDVFTEMFWKMGIASFHQLFGAIDHLKAKSLTLTRKVLSRREELENYIESVQPMIRNGFTVLDKLRQQIIVIQKYGDLINANKNFTYTVSVNKAKQTANNGAFNTTTCLECNFTCHRSCAFSDNADKARCCAMGSDGLCRCCPQKCHWSMHKNKPYTVEWYSVKENRTTAELKSKYYDATSKKSIEEQVMAGSVGELAKVEQGLNGLIKNVRDCLNELSKIALRPNVLSQDDYIDKLIQSEEAERKPGFKQRIAALKQLKEKQEILVKMNNDEYNPWAQYQDVQKFIGSNQNVKQKVNKPTNGRQRNNRKSRNGWFSGWF